MNEKILHGPQGFFDGEGSFTVKKSRPHYPFVTIAQVDKSVLTKFAKIVGFGKVYGPYEHGNNPNRTPAYWYQAWNFEKTQAILAMLWPWLSDTKRKQGVRVLNGAAWTNG